MAWHVAVNGWDFWAGLLIGLDVIVLVAIQQRFLAWMGFSPRQMGLDAERETGRILKRLDDRWRVQPNLLIDDLYDIDHVIIGADRVHAVETMVIRTAERRWLPGAPRSRTSRRTGQGAAGPRRRSGGQGRAGPLGSGIRSDRAGGLHGSERCPGRRRRPVEAMATPRLQKAATGEKPDADMIAALATIREGAI